jgi:hypothetical protein
MDGMVILKDWPRTAVAMFGFVNTSLREKINSLKKGIFC